MNVEKWPKRLAKHCAALKATLAAYLRLIRSSAGQWRWMFEARAASVERELAEVCGENRPTEPELEMT